MRILLISAALLLLGACDHDRDEKRGQHARTAADTAADTGAINRLESAQIAAITRKDAAGSVAPYGKDAVFIGDNGAIVSGSDSIAAMFRKFVTDPNLKIDYHPGPKTFSDDGSMAWSTAAYTESYTNSASGKAVTVKGTNLSVWRKQADGAWKLVADSNPGVIAG